MSTRNGNRMVDQDDPQWQRFWNAYPHRVSKKEARKAWAALNPDLALVDQMLGALAWQAPLWARQGYGTPYPASWLNAERWTDERPANGSGHHAPTFEPWTCPHEVSCLHRAMCNLKDAMPHKYPHRKTAS